MIAAWPFRWTALRGEKSPPEGAMEAVTAQGAYEGLGLRNKQFSLITPRRMESLREEVKLMRDTTLRTI